jgi:WS/DGAT/MGAT family acyltransferase
MQQVSGLDATFLFLETQNAPMHIGSVGIFDPSTAPDGIVRFKRIIQTVEERAHLAPYLRQRLVEVPFNADFPYWVRDESFDPEFHIRHIALPKPGDWRQLCIQVARLQARALDRSRPLWELYIIEGLDNVEGIPPGCFAMVTKLHHAAIDGVSSQAIAAALCDATPEIRSGHPPYAVRADGDGHREQRHAPLALPRISTEVRTRMDLSDGGRYEWCIKAATKRTSHTIQPGGIATPCL